MVSLTDIAAPTKAVEIQGQQVDVKGVSAIGIAVLLGRFPELRQLVSGRSVSIEPGELIRLVPEGVAAFIAAGVNAPGDRAMEEAAAALPLGDQVTLLEEIIKLTFPGGLGPFLDKLGAVMDGAGLGGGTKVPASN